MSAACATSASTDTSPHAPPALPRPDIVQLTSLVHAYLREGNFQEAARRVRQMRELGLIPTFKTWATVVGGAARSTSTKDCCTMLESLSYVGFDVPERLLLQCDDDTWTDVDSLLTWLLSRDGDGGTERSTTNGNDARRKSDGSAARSMVNVLIDLLWCFGQRARAHRLFLLSLQRGVYPRCIAHAATDDWKLDVRTLSPGAALVALHHWLDMVQDAALQGVPAPRHVSIVTGGMLQRISSTPGGSVSLKRTVRSWLWAMGAPFRSDEDREGVLTAKGYSVERWVKDSPSCQNLCLEDSVSRPPTNTMCIYENALMRTDVAALLQELEEHRLLDGKKGPPRVMSRLLRIKEEKKDQWIQMQAALTETRGQRAAMAKKKRDRNRELRKARKTTNR
ncbi:hypothetical protein CLOM_g14619 [Closterium sp. NIES-68]|nr:hypothetical protein CLOM_g14619 [Closterium sp. NIES-68]